MKINATELVILLVIVGGILYVTTNGFKSFTSTGTSTTQYTQSATCPATAQNVNLYQNAVNYATNPPTPVGAITLYSIYEPNINGGTVAVTSGTSANVVSALAGAGCNTAGWVVGGDNIHNFESKVSFFTGGNVTTNVNVALLNYTVAVVQGSAKPLTSTAAAPVPINGITGTSVTNATMTVQAGTSYAGKEGEVVIFAYNNLAVSAVNLAGATPFYGRVPAQTGGFTNGENAQVAYFLPSGHYQQYITPTGVFGGYTTFNPQVTLVATLGSGIMTPIGVTVAALSDYQAVNGTWMTSQAVASSGAALVGTAGNNKFFEITQN